MKYLFILLWLIGRRQEDDHSVDEYYYYIYRAEASIIDNNFSSASCYYDSAFATRLTAFSPDLYNASICAIYNNKNDKVLSLAEQLVLKGADTSFFKQRCFSPFVSSMEWKKLKEEYGNLIKKRHINYDLIKKIQLLNNIDQGTHCVLPQNAKDIEFVTNMHRLDDSLNASLTDLLTTNDYLSEDIIGGNFEDTILYPNPVWYNLLFHEFEKEGDKPAVLTAMVKDAVRFGKLRPESGIALLEDEDKVWFSHVYFVKKDILVTTIFDPNVPEIYTNLLSAHPTARASQYDLFYHLDSTHNIVKKIVYNYHRYLAIEKSKQPTPFLFFPSLNISDGDIDTRYERIVDAGK